MSFSHREETRGDRHLDILTDDAAGLRLIVSRLGGEMISLSRRNPNGDWVGFLHRDDDLSKPEGGWSNHATVMGYFLHRLKDGRSVYCSQPIEGNTHSFLRTKVWHRLEVSVNEGKLTYRVTKADYTPLEYPLDVSLDLTYQLVGESVSVTFEFTNHEAKQTAHLEFGLHPGFAARSFDSFQLEMPAGTYRRHFSPQNYLSEETEVINFQGGAMPFAREDLPGSYILEFVNVPDRRFVYTDEASSRAVTIDLAGVPYVTLWSDGGAFVCVEPCWGLTDHHQQRAFEDKEGIQKIRAGDRLTASFTMKPQLITTR